MWDEAAKQADREVPALEDYASLVGEQLEMS
jgi:hypothetical protein